MFDEAIISEAGRRLVDASPPGTRVILFGSHARGEAGQHSDLDFLVIEPEVEHPGAESVQLRRALGDLWSRLTSSSSVSSELASGVMCVEA